VHADDLQNFFNEFGAFDARIAKDPQGKSRGFGFVDVETKEQAEKALSLNNELLNGEHIAVFISD